MKNKFLFTFIIVPFCFIYSQQIDWKIIGKMKYPVAGGEIVFNGSQVNPTFYFLGGHSSDFFQTKINWIQEYDVLSSTWKVFPFFMKNPRSLFIAGLWNSRIVYVGGSKENTMEYLDYLDEQEPVSFDTNSNFNRLNVSGHVIGDDLFIIGGTDNSSKDSLPFIAAYNLIQKEITYSFSFLNYFSNTQDIMTVAAKDQIYLFGGVLNHLIVNTINKFDVPNKKLFLLSQKMMYPRAGGCAVYNPYYDKIFVVGGYDELNSALPNVEVIQFNPDGTINISDGPPLKIARKYPMVISYENKIYVFGGFDKYNQVVRDIEVYEDTGTTSVSQDIMPKEYALFQNYPNPFNPTTNIMFDLPKESYVSLKIYNVLGKEVATLVDNIMPAGHKEILFDASRYASGMYIYKLKAGSFVQVKKMLFMK